MSQTQEEFDREQQQLQAEYDASVARFLIEFGEVTCPACMQHPIHDHPITGCLLSLIMDQVEQRDSVQPYDLYVYAMKCNLDHLWARFREILADFEAGHYTDPTWTKP